MIKYENIIIALYRELDVIVFANNVVNRSKYLAYKIVQGFTLAEVLITLIIIGIVASIVIPGLINDTQDAELAIALKKNYGMIKQSFMRYKVDNGNDLSSLFPAGQPHTYALDRLAPYLNIAKKCGTGSGCWATSTKSYESENDGTGNYVLNDRDYDSSGLAKALLADGTSIAIANAATSHGSGQTCHYEYDTFETDENGNFALDGGGNKIPLHVQSSICGFIYIDVNGPKGPNRYGIDTFYFDIYPNRLIDDDTNVHTILSGGRLVR